MDIQPAERCLCGCTLLQGVHILAMYTSVIGVFNFVSLLTVPPSSTPRNQSEISAVVNAVTMVIGTFGLVAGLKGFLGVTLREPSRVRVLFVYHVILLMQSCVVIIVKENDICDILEKEKRSGKLEIKHLDCRTAQICLFIEFTVHFLVFGYFTFIIWSLVKKLEEAGPGGNFFQDPDDQLGGPFFTMGSGMRMRQALWGPGPTGSPFGIHPPNLQQMPLNRHYNEQNAFTGQPQTLDDFQQPRPVVQQPFTGTAHRID